MIKLKNAEYDCFAYKTITKKIKGLGKYNIGDHICLALNTDNCKNCSFYKSRNNVDMNEYLKLFIEEELKK